MESIDPSLRQEEHQQQQHQQQQQQQQQQVANDTSDNAFVFTNDAPNTTTEHDEQLAQQLAAQGLPYYNEQLAHSADQANQQHPVQQLQTPVPAKPVAPIAQQTPIQFTPNEPKRRPKSCESCRGLKVKCEPNEAGQGEGPCKRCVKASRECVYSETSGRRRKKQDNKVAELEKRVTGLTALLASQGTEAAEGLEENSKKRSRSEFEQGDTVEGRPAKVQATIPMVDTTVLNELVKINGPAIQGLVTGLKTVDSWYKQQHSIKPVNGSKAPTAKMGGGTPLELLSQVASSEKPPQSQVYSPYGGYYDKKDGIKNDLAEMLDKEFGSRADLVLGFLGIFLQGNSESIKTDDASANS